MFIPMVWAYFERTRDLELVQTLLPYLEKEFDFWMQHRTMTLKTKTGQSHLVAHYNSDVGVPRPESYAEDYSHAQDFFQSEAERRHIDSFTTFLQK